MEPSATVQDLTLKQFILDLATNPQLQMKLASLYRDTLHRFLMEQGLSDVDAHLLADAQVSEEGRNKLAQELTVAKPPWTCSLCSGMDE